MTTNKDKEEDIQQKLEQIQMYQQRLQVFAAQKQQIQIQQIETENALAEVSKTKKPVYSIIGGIMIERPAKDVKKELEEQQKIMILKLKTLKNKKI